MSQHGKLDFRRIFTDKATFLAIIALAWPTVLEQALQTVVQYADTAMVGQIGAQASAAVGLTISVTWLVNGPFFAMGVGVLACISRAFGAGQPERAKIAGIQSIWLVVILGIVIGGATLGVSPFLPGWLGAAEEIRRDAAIYFGITCVPMLFRSSSIIFGSVLRAAGNTRTPMLVNVLVNGVNIVMNFLLINETGSYHLLGFPVTIWGAGLGVAGAAIATALSHTVGGILMFLSYYRNPVLSPKGHKLGVDRDVMEQCVRVGLPVMLERATACLGQVVFTSLVTRLGTMSIAAHSIALTAEQAFYVPGYGMQAAAATLAGNALGERDEGKLQRVTVLTTAIAVAVMCVGGLVLFLFPQALMGIFTKDASVIALGASALRIVAISEPLFAVLIILEGVFNGIGDTKSPFIFCLISMWGIRIVFTWLSVAVFGLGLQAVWMCMVADNVTRCLLLATRFLRGCWKKRVGLLHEA